MHIQKIIIFYLLIVSMLWSDAIVANIKGNNSLDVTIQSTVDYDKKKYHLPNLSVSILLPEESTSKSYVSGSYSFKNNQKITSDTLFKMGSITKTFTATIIMQLIEENKLKLSDCLNKWFPEYPRWKTVTVKDLLLNTSGIYDYVHNDDDVWHDLKINPNKQWKMHDLTDLAYRYPNYFNRGIGYHYSNTDYVLLGLIIEKITHQSIQAIFKEYFHHYHLPNTFLNLSDVNKAKLAHGYNRDGTFPYNSDVTFINTSLGQTDGAIISTPEDITYWLYQLFNKKIISEQSINSMMELISPKTGKYLTNNICPIKKELSKISWTEIGYGSGMGLVYFKKYGFTWMHTGGIAGYESLYAYNPCTGIYVVLSYGVKPKQPFIFLEIAKDLFSILNQSNAVKEKIKIFQKTHHTPVYCECNDSILDH